MDNKHGAHYTSKSQLWNTPKDLFNTLDCIWNLTLDVACLESSALCDKFFTPDDDGLIQDWSNDICWCNPPYDDIKTWAMKCAREAKKGATILLLIPSRTDTVAFHDYLFPSCTCVCFIKGRLCFINPDSEDSNIIEKNSAPFPSSIFVFDQNMNDEKYDVLEKFGTIMNINNRI